jgi:HK97 family phage major capsid protein
MDSKTLNKRKAEILDQQTLMLQKATEAKVKLTETEEQQFKAYDAELLDINTNIQRFDAISKGRTEVGTPANQPVITNDKNAKKFYAFGGNTHLSNVDGDYVKKFWASLRDKSTFDRFQFENAALGEAGSTAAGGALVPIETDPSIPNLQIEETAIRGLSRVITTEMDINVPYQATKSVAALKTESTSSGTHAFAENEPTFATTKLSAYMLGDSVYASWELLQDAKAASAFITADLARAIRVKEEYYFVNGSGTSQPQGYLGNATTATGADITAGAATLAVNPLLDTLSSLNRAYYSNAKWLVNRQEFNRILKKQLAANQVQTFVTWDANGDARLFGYPVEFSAEMGVYVASPSAQGNWLFGDFNSFAVIGDRGDSNIKIKVLDQVAALNGQTVILGYRRVDQRIVLQEAVVQFNTTG